jgi:hypothetical protein
MPLVAASLMALTNGSTIGPIIWFDMICIGTITAILIARETKSDKLG